MQFGYATRYGAVTRDEEGEVVAGITLMLKGENFQQVIKNVKERMAQIQKSLPEEKAPSAKFRPHSVLCFLRETT